MKLSPGAWILADFLHKTALDFGVLALIGMALSDTLNPWLPTTLQTHTLTIPT